MEVTNNNVFVDTKFVDLNALGIFLRNVRTEVADNYVNTSNAATTENIDSIFGGGSNNANKFTIRVVTFYWDDALGDFAWKELDKEFELEFEEGMTWGEWVDSDYNIYNYTVDSDYISTVGKEFGYNSTFYLCDEKSVNIDAGILVKSGNYIFRELLA